MTKKPNGLGVSSIDQVQHILLAGGIINSRIETVRYGVRDEKAGACGSVLNLFEERFNHHPRLYRGPLEEECRDQLQEFFLDLREKESFPRNV